MLQKYTIMQVLDSLKIGIYFTLTFLTFAPLFITYETGKKLILLFFSKNLFLYCRKSKYEKSKRMPDRQSNFFLFLPAKLILTELRKNMDIKFEVCF